MRQSVDNGNIGGFGVSIYEPYELDELILNLADDAMEKFLMEINTGDLAKALKAMGGQAQIRIFNNLPQKAAYALKDSMEDMDLVVHPAKLALLVNPDSPNIPASTVK